MTIICPQKKQDLKYFLIALFALVLGGGALYIIGNGSLVEQRHAWESSKKELVTLKTENADLKNEYYRLTDPAQLEAVATASGLRLEKRPQYLTTAQ